MRQPRIPIKVVLFNLWITTTNTYLQSDDPSNPGHKQYVRLGLTLVEATSWDNSTTAWIAMYAKYSDKAQRTLAIMRQCRDFRISFSAGSRGIVNRIAASPAATQQDATVFNFVLNRKSPTRRKTPITNPVLVGITHSGSTQYDVQCRHDKDTKKPSLLPGADGVECSFSISATEPANTATIDPTGAGFQQRTYNQARFVFKSGTGNKGKFLLIAFRWNFSPNTDFNGPWSDVQVMVIS